MPYASLVTAGGWIVIWGNGFSTGGNAVQLMGPGYGDVWLREGDGHDFWDLSGAQINAKYGRAVPGQWTLYVHSNGSSGGQSPGYTITINP